MKKERELSGPGEGNDEKTREQSAKVAQLLEKDAMSDASSM